MRGARARCGSLAGWSFRLSIALASAACCHAGSATDAPSLPFDPLADEEEAGSLADEEEEVMPIDAGPLPPDEHLDFFPALVWRGEHPLELHPLVDGLLASADFTLVELRDDGARIDKKLSEGLPSAAKSAFPRFFSLAGRWPDSVFASFDDGATLAFSGGRWTKTSQDDAWLTASSPRTGSMLGLRVGASDHPLLVARPAASLPALPMDFTATELAAAPNGDVLAMSRDGIAILPRGAPRFVMDVLPAEIGHGVALAARSREDAFVLGDHGVAHFDGKAWDVTAAPFVMGEEISGTIADTGEAWCIEWMMGFSRLFHRTPAGAWTVVPIPDVIAGQKKQGGEAWFPEAVVMRAPGDVWVVAAYRHEAASGAVGSPSALLHTKPVKKLIDLGR